MEDRKRISVLIVTHNRPKGLNRCLEALSAQAVIPDEVVVVNNGSLDNKTQEVIADYSGVFKLKRVLLEKTSVSAARNSALRNSSGELALFVDDDCIPDKRLIEEALRADILFPEAAVIQGGVVGSAYSVLGKAMQVHYDVYFRRCYFIDRSQKYLRYIWTSNALFRKDLILRANGWFDDSLLSSEDRELGMRLIRRGLSIQYYPSMIVTHEYDGRSLGGMCSAAWNRASAKSRAGYGGENYLTALLLMRDMFCKTARGRAATPLQKLGVISVNLVLYSVSWFAGVCGCLRFGAKNDMH